MPDGKNRVSLNLRAASGYPQVETLLSGMLINLLFLNREEDDHLWEPLNPELLARHDIKLSKYDVDDLVKMSEDNNTSEEGEL